MSVFLLQPSVFLMVCWPLCALVGHIWSAIKNDSSTEFHVVSTLMSCWFVANFCMGVVLSTCLDMHCFMLNVRHRSCLKTQ